MMKTIFCYHFDKEALLKKGKIEFEDVVKKWGGIVPDEIFILKSDRIKRSSAFRFKNIGIIIMRSEVSQSLRILIHEILHLSQKAIMFSYGETPEEIHKQIDNDAAELARKLEARYVKKRNC